MATLISQDEIQGKTQQEADTNHKRHKDLIIITFYILNNIISK